MFLCLWFLGHSPEKLTLTLKLVFIVIDDSFNLFFYFWWKSFTNWISEVLILPLMLFECLICKSNVICRVQRAKILFQNERIFLMHRIPSIKRIGKSIKNRFIFCELWLNLNILITFHSLRSYSIVFQKRGHWLV